MNRNNLFTTPLALSLFVVFLFPTGVSDLALFESNGLVGGVQIIQDVYLQAQAPPPQKSQVLVIIMDRIIECESENDSNACNTCEGTEWEGLYDPSICPCGAGLCGLIPSTLKYCEEMLGRELDPFDPEDNLDCCWWLLENEGIDHWLQSKDCWAK